MSANNGCLRDPLSKQGKAKADPIAPAPIITILDILIFKKYFFDN